VFSRRGSCSRSSSSTIADAAADFTCDLQTLRARYAHRAPVSVFFQIDENPL
jgi:hypothetical protein